MSSVLLTGMLGNCLFYIYSNEIILTLIINMLLDVFVISTFNNKIVHRIRVNLCKIFLSLLNVEKLKQIKKSNGGEL